MPSSGLVLLNISSKITKLNSSLFNSFILLICSNALLISASYNDSLPLESGIFKYVLMIVKGVTENTLAGTIDKVCENKTHKDNDFINVDFPPAFGPVIKAFCGFKEPSVILFLT